MHSSCIVLISQVAYDMHPCQLYYTIARPCTIKWRRDRDIAPSPLSHCIFDPSNIIQAMRLGQQLQLVHYSVGVNIFVKTIVDDEIANPLNNCAPSFEDAVSLNFFFSLGYTLVTLSLRICLVSIGECLWFCFFPCTHHLLDKLPLFCRHVTLIK